MSQFDTLAALIAAAQRAGADRADAMLVMRTSLSVERRLSRTETLERAESRDLGLRVFVGKRAAGISISDPDPAGFAALAERAVAMARIVPEDPHGGLAEDWQPAEDNRGLELDDGQEPAIDALIARADAAEAAGMAVPGVTNSEGGNAGFSRSQVWLATSDGFTGSVARSHHSVSASVLAGSGTAMQRDYDYHAVAHLADLDPPDLIGRRAGEQAVARLNPQRPRTGRLPVVFDPRVSGSILGHLAGLINGASVVRGTTFLKDAVGSKIFPDTITIIDDPRRTRGFRSGTFDGEGVPTARRALIDQGVLTGFVLDSRSARALGLRSTGHASRSPGGTPGPATSNLYLQPGAISRAGMLAAIPLGLYVTEMIGNAINPLTGDYSRGAAGFMIRDGALAEPVAEITIAGNLRDMFTNLAAADDLVLRRGTDAPTLRIDGMTMAGA